MRGGEIAFYRESDTEAFLRVAASSNNHMHSDSKKRRSFLAMLFAAGDVRRYAPNEIEDGTCTAYW